MARELSQKEKQEYDKLTRFCKQLTLADFSEVNALKNLPHTDSSGAQEEKITIVYGKSS